MQKTKTHQVEIYFRNEIDLNKNIRMMIFDFQNFGIIIKYHLNDDHPQLITFFDQYYEKVFLKLYSPSLQEISHLVKIEASDAKNIEQHCLDWLGHVKAIEIFHLLQYHFPTQMKEFGWWPPPKPWDLNTLLIFIVTITLLIVFLWRWNH